MNSKCLTNQFKLYNYESLFCYSNRAAARVVAENLADNNSYPTTLLAKVDSNANNLLGKISKTKLFEATDNLQKVIAPGHKDISSLKIQLIADYEKTPAKLKIIFDDLGYNLYYKKVTARNQLAIIGLLISLNSNINKYKAEFIANGTPADLVDRTAISGV